jgi:hypothetical protein
MNKQALLPTFLVFLLPFLSDLVIFGGSGQMDKALSAPAILIGNGVFAAFPFLLIGSMMRPRRRVTIALWCVAALTGLIWAIFAWSGLDYQKGARDGTLNIALSMIQMVWPFAAVILMGVIAKFNEGEAAAEGLPSDKTNRVE